MRLATRIIHSHKKSIKLQEINNSPKEKEVKAKPVNNPSFTRQPVNFCLVLSYSLLRPDIDVGLSWVVLFGTRSRFAIIKRPR